MNASPRAIPDHLSVFGLDVDRLTGEMLGRGWERFRPRQVLDWLYRRRASAFANMTNLPKTMRQTLEQEFAIYESTVTTEQQSRDGTRKMLLRWPDDATTECVLIPDGERRTACISTQVGCPVRCTFCASGMNGLERQLTTGEIVEQAMRVQEACGAGQRLTNVVFMGLGEPLANYAATVAAIRIINADWGMGIGARKITVSTVGLPGQMRRLADEGLQITLAVSIHAPTDALRRELIPWAESVTLKEIVAAAAYYFDQTGRETTLEYVLLADVNDQPEHARNLAALSKRMRSNVNLLAFNPVPELPFQRPPSTAREAFLQTLRRLGVNAHLRRSRGLDVDSACGQLRRRTTA